jgi:outer membrane receptor protein involved in Fe transport
MQKKSSKLTQALIISSLTSGAGAAILDEVVVVAQKRAQSLQDVPVSVAAVDADKISDAGIVDLQGLSDYVPNFSINETGISTTITVRGISSGINSGFEQSVGMYNDGIFYGRDQLARIPVFDMERVEILRGPQGILYGKNSIAGAVSQITAKPTEDFESSITGLYESENGEEDLRMVLSGPLSETVSGRIAILDRSLDGYIFNTVSKQDEQQEDEQLIRASLQWDINEDITANFKTSRATFDTLGRNLEVYGDTKLEGVTGALSHLTALNVLTGGITLDATGKVTATNPDKYIEGKLNRSGSMNKSSIDNEVNNTTLSVDWQLDGLTVTSVTGYVDYEFDELCDCDFTGAEIFNATRDEKYSQFSQELRFTSELGNTVDYIGGLFFQKTDLDYKDVIAFPDNSIMKKVFEQAGGSRAAVANLVNGSSTQRTFDQDGDLWAIFAQATWNIADNLRLTAGGRYTDENKEAKRMQKHQKNASAIKLGDMGDMYTVALYGAFLIEPHEVEGKLNDESFTPLVSVQWDADDQTMLYATWTQGYKSGGFDARSNAHPDVSVKNAKKDGKDFEGAWEFKREKANSYELGSKMVLADGAAELNLALYLTEYKDLQLSQFDGTLGFNVTNAGEATVQGLEADGRWAITDNIILTGSAAYLDFNYDKFPNSQCYFGQASSYAADHEYAGLCDAAGKRKEYTPEFQANIGAVWSGQIADGYHLDAGMDLVYMDEYIYAANLDPKAMQDAYALLNARISLANLDDTWEVALIGRNLTDETVINFGGNTPLASTLTGGKGNSYYGFVNRPRNIALQGVYRF